jgi:hypothetical protein
MVLLDGMNKILWWKMEDVKSRTLVMTQCSRCAEVMI